LPESLLATEQQEREHDRRNRTASQQADRHPTGLVDRGLGRLRRRRLCRSRRRGGWRGVGDEDPAGERAIQAGIGGGDGADDLG
jgi:hypothetical protein